MEGGGVRAALAAIAIYGVAGALGACAGNDLTFIGGRPAAEGPAQSDRNTGTAGHAGARNTAEKIDAAPTDAATAIDAFGSGGAGGAGAEASGPTTQSDAAGNLGDAIGNVGDATFDQTVDTTATEAGRDAGEAGVAVGDGGPANVVFSFDLDPDFTPWKSVSDVDGLSSAGPLAPAADEAVPGHLPARALGWTATFTAYQTSVRALAEFPTPRNWTGRSALHFTVKIRSGISSLKGYQIYVQAGGPGFASRYLDEQPIANIADSTSFHDISLPLTNTTISTSVTFIGLVLSSVSPPPGAGTAPPPATVEIDDIWLE